MSQQRNPIVLVHGMWDTTAIFDKLQPFLASRGLEVHSFNMLPSNGAATLEVLAGQLAAFVQKTLGATQPIDLVGFSMGGIVSRYYLQRLGGLDRTKRFVSVSSPHNGTMVAEFGLLPGAKQMRVGSLFLQDLNRDIDRLAKLQVTSIWTPFDAVIVPAASSQLAMAENHTVPVIWHKLMMSDRRCFALIAAALEKPIVG
jgi:triacylglycerol lipase